MKLLQRASVKASRLQKLAVTTARSGFLSMKFFGLFGLNASKEDSFSATS